MIVPERLKAVDNSSKFFKECRRVYLLDGYQMVQIL